jgi:hypothetical protein
LPLHPILLTCDDGYASAWTDATPILRKHHASAAMFFEGRLTDLQLASEQASSWSDSLRAFFQGLLSEKSPRLTADQLVEMKRSGVWYLQSHGWAGHSNLVVDASGTSIPYWYANLAWLPDQGRLETRPEFEERIRADLHRFKTTFEPIIHEKIDSFAFPSGEFGQNGPLAPGGNPRTRLEAGHSNAGDLTPLLRDALGKEGYTSAFAVSLPGGSHAASLQDDILALPRLGIGAEFTIDSLHNLTEDAIELPEIAPNDTFADPGPLAFQGGKLWTASSSRPRLYRLSRTGRIEATWRIPELMEGRGSNPSLISGILPSEQGLVIVQKAGWGVGASPCLTRVRFEGERPVIVERRRLAKAASWLVGVTELDGRGIGMTDEGRFIDLQSGSVLFSLALADTFERHGRFAGPIVVGDALLVYDRMEHEVLSIRRDGAVIESAPLRGDVRNLATGPDGFFTVDWSDRRHIVRYYRLKGYR